MKETSAPGSGSAPCPNCGEPASGRFCSNCGTPLGGVACGACHAELAAGAKFCHSCGTPVAVPGATPAPAAAGVPAGTTAPASGGHSNLPLAIVGIAFLAVVAIVAGQSFARAGSGGAQAGPMAGGGGAPAMGAAPDISQMTPEERASRLYDRMMGAFEAGHMDTVQMFAPMATAAYEMLDSLTLDERYDLGRLGEISGANALATAQADTILQQNPNHLLGLILAAQAAHSRNDSAAENKYLARLVKAAPAEQAKNRPEYQEHQNDIKAALDQARKR
jgi:hypothetical protein